jgi:hypothetical protein
MDAVYIFFIANFQILGPLGCQGCVVIPQNVKKVKITAPYSAAYAASNFARAHCSDSGSLRNDSVSLWRECVSHCNDSFSLCSDSCLTLH